MLRFERNGEAVSAVQHNIGGSEGGRHDESMWVDLSLRFCFTPAAVPQYQLQHVNPVASSSINAKSMLQTATPCSFSIWKAVQLCIRQRTGRA